jgi:hypothetical protein
MGGGGGYTRCNLLHPNKNKQNPTIARLLQSLLQALFLTMNEEA